MELYFQLWETSCLRISKCKKEIQKEQNIDGNLFITIKWIRATRVKKRLRSLWFSYSGIYPWSVIYWSTLPTSYVRPDWEEKKFQFKKTPLRGKKRKQDESIAFSSTPHPIFPHFSQVFLASIFNTPFTVIISQQSIFFDSHWTKNKSSFSWHKLSSLSHFERSPNIRGMARFTTYLLLHQSVDSGSPTSPGKLSGIKSRIEPETCHTFSRHFIWFKY